MRIVGYHLHEDSTRLVLECGEGRVAEKNILVDVAGSSLYCKVRELCMQRVEGESARKWMFVVARNLCISLLRRSSTRGEVPLDCCAENISTDPIPPEKALANERNRQIERAIGKLPDDMREVIILREYEGMDYEEISGIVKCPIGTVRSRLARARAILQKELAPYMEE